MKVRNFLTAAGTCAIIMAPAVGSAQDEGGFMMEEGPAKKPQPIFDNEVEGGIGYNTEDSFKFGEYTGLTDSEPFLIFNFDLKNRDAWDSGDTGYYRIQGKDLGLESRRFEAEYGDQGHYSIGLSYREIPHNLIKDARTPYRGTGGNVLTLPAGWAAAPTTNAFTTLGQSLRNTDIETKRRKLTGSFSYLPDPSWQFDLDVTHKERDGTKPVFATFATNGGNPSSVALPRPDEFSVNEINAKADYAAGDLQMEFRYTGSFFNDKNNVLLFQNPYSRQASGGPWAPGTGYPSSGGYGLPPDNESHQFTFSSGYTLGEASRLSGQLSYAMMTQDDQFLPYSTNPALRANRPLPRQSLDGELDVLVADLAYSTRLQPATSLRAHARYEDQDNSTPRDVYVRIVGDAQNQPAGIANSNARINLPYSFKKTHFDTELEHRLTRDTQLGVEYKFDRDERTFSEVDRTTEHTVGAKVRHRFSNAVRSRFIYRHAERDGNGYEGDAPFLAGHTQQFLNTLAPDERFENHPEIRKFNQADRSLNELKAIVNVASTPMTSWSVTGSWQNEDFNDTSLGLTDRELWRASADVNHTLSDAVMLHGFYAYEQFDDTIRGHSFRPGQSLTAPAQRWLRDATDRVHSIGAGFTWSAIPDKLDVDVNYTASLARTTYDFSGGSAQQPVEDAPTLKSTLHSLDVRADWKLREDRRVRFGYTFEYFDANDFTVDGIGVNSVSRLLTFGNGAPHYTAHVFGVSYVANW